MELKSGVRLSYLLSEGVPETNYLKEGVTGLSKFY